MRLEMRVASPARATSPTSTGRSAWSRVRAASPMMNDGDDAPVQRAALRWRGRARPGRAEPVLSAVASAGLPQRGRQGSGRRHSDGLPVAGSVAVSLRQHPRLGRRPEHREQSWLRSGVRSGQPARLSRHTQDSILFYHSVLDELAPVAKMQQLAARYCTEGVTVRTVESIAGEHAIYAVLGAPTALSYLADRFAGRPAPDDC